MLELTFYNSQLSNAFPLNLTNAVKTCIRRNIITEGDASFTVILKEGDLYPFIDKQVFALDIKLKSYQLKGKISDEELNDFLGPYIKMVNNLAILKYSHSVEQGKEDSFIFGYLNEILSNFYSWLYDTPQPTKVINYNMSSEEKMLNHIKPYTGEELVEAEDELDID